MGVPISLVDGTIPQAANKKALHLSMQGSVALNSSKKGVLEAGRQKQVISALKQVMIQ
jgi:hypothetical protein